MSEIKFTDSAFDLGNELNLRFKFRTSTFDGSIISIFPHSGDISFEVCLTDNVVSIYVI